jgi:hypothetical protein
MQKVLKLFDILGEENFVLLYNNKRHRTVLGGSLSIILIIFYIVMMIILIVEYTNYRNIIHVYEVYDNVMKPILLNYDIQIYDIDSNRYLDSKLFEVTLVKYQNFDKIDVYNTNYTKNEKIEIFKNMDKIKFDNRYIREDKTSCLKIEIKPVIDISLKDLIVKLEIPERFNLRNFDRLETNKKSFFHFSNKYVSYIRKVEEYEDEGLIFSSYSLKNEYSIYQNHEIIDTSKFFELYFIASENILVQQKLNIKFLPQAGGIYCLFKLILLIFRLINNNELNAFYYSLIKRDIHFQKIPTMTINQNKRFHHLNINSDMTFPKKQDDQLHTIIRIQKKNSYFSNNTVKNMLGSSLGDKQTKSDAKIVDIKFSFIEIIRLYMCCKASRNLQNYFVSKEKLKRMLSIDHIINKLYKIEQDMKEMNIDDKLLNQSFIINDYNSIK